MLTDVLQSLRPGKHSRKAIFGGAVGFFTAFSGGLKDGEVSLFEISGIIAATVLGYLVVWAGVNEPPKGEREIGGTTVILGNDSGLTTLELLMVLTFVGVLILLAVLVF